MEGAWWAIGVLFALWSILFGYIWKLRDDIRDGENKAEERDAKLIEKVNTSVGDLSKHHAETCREFSERITRLEITMEPWREIMMKAVPSLLNLHHSPDVLEEAFQGPPDEEKIRVAEERVQREWDSDPPPDRKLTLLLATWLLKVRRNELELARKEARDGNDTCRQ